FEGEHRPPLGLKGSRGAVSSCTAVGWRKKKGRTREIGREAARRKRRKRKSPPSSERGGGNSTEAAVAACGGVSRRQTT
ncbi:hypothetical protein LINGRAPRIM_LOCUS233, partial [Linum grandiflorum]